MSRTGTLVIMLSSMQDTDYILEAFARGADDYIVKPFNLQILKAKIEALFRRYQPERSQANKVETIILNDLVINSRRREVTVAGQKVSLTALEFDLLYFLASNANQVWDRAELIAEIWNREDYSGDDRKVDIHIGRIRRKIGDRDGTIVKTIWGRGYMFEIPNGDEVELAD